MTRILYIAGYGRSGSTVLAGVLGCDASTASVGEVSFLFEDGSREDRVCSCGSSYRTCAMWGGWTSRLSEDPELPRVVRSIENYRGLRQLWLGRVPEGDAGTYASAQAGLFNYVVSSTGAEVVVDGSKTAWLTVGRPLGLAELAGLDVRVLHLVRDGRRVLESTAKLSNWEIEGRRRPRRPSAIRSTAGWVFANREAEKLRGRLGDGRYMRLRWEDFLADPAGSVSTIGDFVGVDYSELALRIEREADFEVGHVVGGNRVRFSGSLRLERRSPDRETPTLSLRQTALFGLLGRRMNRRYGYGLNNGG